MAFSTSQYTQMHSCSQDSVSLKHTSIWWVSVSLNRHTSRSCNSILIFISKKQNYTNHMHAQITRDFYFWAIGVKQLAGTPWIKMRKGTRTQESNVELKSFTKNPNVISSHHSQPITHYNLLKHNKTIKTKIDFDFLN